MITTLFAAALVAKGVQETPVLSFHDGAFFIKTGNATTSASLTPPKGTKKPDQVVFRKNDNYAVWDGRGLSVRHKNRTKSSRLNDIALTPKLFQKDQIIETRKLIADGVRQKEASALSGARRIGSEVFFLVRWNDTNGKAWLEALVKVDLDSDNPSPQLIGKFDGISLSSKPIDDNLFTIGESICALTKADGSWNLAKYDLKEKTFSAYVQGLDLISYSPISRQLGIFVEKASDGAYVIGRVDLVTGSRRNLLETRKKATVLDEVRPTIVTLDGTTIQNLESGALTPIPSGSKALRTTKGVIVYWPAAQPKKAILLDPERWSQLAKWDFNQVVPVKPKPVIKAQPKNKADAATKKPAKKAKKSSDQTEHKNGVAANKTVSTKAVKKTDKPTLIKPETEKPVKKTTAKKIAKAPAPVVEVIPLKPSTSKTKKPVKAAPKATKVKAQA